MEDAQVIIPEGTGNSGVKELRIISVRVQNERGNVSNQIDIRKPFFVEIEYQIMEHIPQCRVGFKIQTGDGISVFQAYDSDEIDFSSGRNKGKYLATCKIPGTLLAPQRYYLSINAGIVGIKNLASLPNIIYFDVIELSDRGTMHYTDRVGVIQPNPMLKWTTSYLKE